MRRKKAALRLAALIALALPLAGCWDIKSMQDVNYFTGLGVDYADGRYQVYVQQLNFTNVAKAEGGNKSDSPATLSVGHMEGGTVSEAIGKLYRSAQQTAFWGHLEAIVLSENVLAQSDIPTLLDGIIRSPEIRYTPWIYGTKQSIEDIFLAQSFFNLSPVNSILFSPQKNYQQTPTIKPERYYRFIREIREPGNAVILPSLGLAPDSWTRGGEDDPKLMMDGVFALRYDKLQGWFAYDDVVGLKWLENSTVAARVFLMKNGENVGTIRTTRIVAKKKMTFKEGLPVYGFRLKVWAQVIESWKNLGQQEMEKLSGEKIAAEIRDTFSKSVARKTDLLRLEHDLYRKRFGDWKRLTAGGKHALEPLRLGDIAVEVILEEPGMYKMQKEQPRY